MVRRVQIMIVNAASRLSLIIEDPKKCLGHFIAQSGCGFNGGGVACIKNGHLPRLQRA
jgi:hypothetical protein